MKDMVEDQNDFKELLSLENPNFVLDEQFRKTQGSNFTKHSDILAQEQKERLRQQNSFQTKTEVSETPNPVIGSPTPRDSKEFQLVEPIASEELLAS